jgi:S-formylglutathione hydrolase FrmB
MHPRVAAIVLALALLGAPAAARASASDLHVESRTQLSPRLSEVTMSTPALDFPVKVRILVPDGYSDHPRRRYPVLYLLHGSFDTSASWTDKGAAESLTAGLPLIVVMPPAAGKGNAGGWASDWANEGRGGPPRWETFTMGQLIPWVDANLRTVPRRGKRAIAGLSMGGFTAMSYAARHPDRFTAAASFSGAVDTNDPEVWPVIQLETLADGGTTPDAIWGPRATSEIVWRAHNPWDLAVNLGGMTTSIRTGNGHADDGSFDPIEAAVHNMSVSLHDRLAALGIAHVWDDYGNGTHSWPYWQRDLRLELPRLMSAFARRTRRRPFTYTSTDPRFSVYGWRVSMGRSTHEFATLAGASARGFEVRGSGDGAVTTARLFRPGARYRVTVASASRVVRADRRGRLAVAVPLGPTGGGRVYSTRVSIKRVKR